ncbi:MAG TPA: hypothetical protein VF808_07105 [Ktedonobacterales bacterium]
MSEEDGREESAAQRLESLLRDLGELHQYLEERGRRSSELAQRFMANARRDASSRAYDERQATMLEYQRYIWSEIAGRVGKLVNIYGEHDDTGESAGSDVTAVDGE